MKIIWLYYIWYIDISFIIIIYIYMIYVYKIHIYMLTNVSSFLAPPHRLHAGVFCHEICRFRGFLKVVESQIIDELEKHLVD